MGTSPADQSSSPLDTNPGTTINENSKTNSSPNVDGFDLLTASNINSSPTPVSSSPDSPLIDPFRDENTFSINAPSHENERVVQLGSVNTEKPVSGSGVSLNEPSDHESPRLVSTPAVTGDVSDSILDTDLAAESPPPTQVMDRSGYDPNRIPSSVFDRSKSTTNPMDWSVASNESLFSIHMGNASFGKDQAWFRSGELGPPGEVSTSGQMFNFASIPSPAPKPAERKSRDLRTETAVETMKEVIRESEDQSDEKSVAERRISHVSHGSATSTKSFAFPVLTGDTDHGSSARIVGSPRVGAEQQQPKSQPVSDPVPQPEPKAAEATHKTPNKKWFSCFSCCSCC